MEKIADYWEEKSDKQVKCTLCPRGCTIQEGDLGFCQARKNINGELYSIAYGQATSTQPDPIEKKPLYHFYPGTRAFSMSTAGCNFSCKHCQNWTLSQSSVNDVKTEEITPEEAVDKAERTNCDGIAYTYGEPTIWFEYIKDTAKIAKERGLYNVLVTNGYLNQDPLEDLEPYIDGMNVDVKAFNEEFYQDICGGGSLEPVLETCEWAVENDIHLEITNLIIPDENDDEEEIRELCQWISEDLDPEVPIHFTRFRPLHEMMNKNSTPINILENAWDIAQAEGLKHVYVGNVPGHEADNTYCPNCEELVIKRRGFSLLEYKLDEEHACPNCGYNLNIKGKHKNTTHSGFQL